MLKKWGALILVILLAAASAGSAELVRITLADGASECGSEGVTCEGDVVTITAPGEYLYRDGARYCPFATNLQIVFYRNRKGLVLVKFLANEEETLIPELKAYSGPYYRWDDVKGYVNDK